VVTTSKREVTAMAYNFAAASMATRPKPDTIFDVNTH
jgi:hypothetical protein